MRASEVSSTDKVKGHYFRGAVWASCGTFVVMFASLGTIMLATRVLIKEEIGAFFLVMLISQVTATLGDLGVRNTAIKYLSSCSISAERANIAHYLISVNLIAALVVCLILFFFIPVITNIWPSAIFSEIILFSIPISFLLLNYQMASSLLIANKEFNKSSLITAGSEVFRMLLSVALLLRGFGVAGLLFAMVLSRIIACIFSWLGLRRVFGLKINHPKGREILQFGGWLYGASIVSMATAKMAAGLVASMLGMSAFALYSTALQIPNSFQRVFESIRPIVLRYVSSSDGDNGSHGIVDSVRLIGVLLAIGVAVIVVFSEPIVLVLFSESYIESVPIMQLICVSIAVGITNYFLSITLIGMGRAKAVFVLSIPQFIVVVLMLLYTLNEYGEVGAAGSLIVAALVGNVCTSVAISKRNFKLFRDINISFLRSTLPLFVFVSYIHTAEPSFVLSLFSLFVLVSLFFLTKSLSVKEVCSIVRLVTRR